MRTIRRRRDTWYVEQDGKVINYFYSEDLARDFAGLPPAEEQEKTVGAIVEESILAADADDDGIITKEEISNWFKDEN